MAGHDAATADLDGWRARYEPYLETLSVRVGAARNARWKMMGPG